MKTPRPRTTRGFTLIELALTAAVLTLLIGVLLIPLATQIERRQIADAQSTLEEIKEALVGFALVQGTPSRPRLPCPHQPGWVPEGTESYTINGLCVGCLAGAGDSVEGVLPWASLGLGASDPWGNRYRYRVMCEYAAALPSTNTLTFATTSHLRVCSDPACAGELTVTTAGNAPAAVILSHGPNGRGGLMANAIPGASPLATVSADEVENTNGNALFVSHPPRARASLDGDEFDDVVAWLSSHVVKSRLVAAGRLP